MSGKSCRRSAQVLLVGLYVVCVYRAFTQSIVFDESLTWELYVLGPASNIFHLYSPNHHFLNTVLARLSTALFGVSEWSMRLPALTGAALYFMACYRLSRTAFGDGFSMLLAIGLASLNPFVLDFMVAARGYGLALALWFWAAAVLLDALSGQEYSRVQLLIAGSALALSVTANLVFILPAAALAAMTVYLVRDWSALPPIPASDPPRKEAVAQSRSRSVGKKRKRKPALQAGKPGLAPWVWFVAPIIVIAVLFVDLAPFEGMRSEHFYTGAPTIRESLRSLASSSLEHSGPLRGQPWAHQWTDVLAFGIAPLTIIAGLITGILRRNLLLQLMAGAAVFSSIASLLIHLLLDKPYPSDRTGLYFLPLATFVLVGLAHVWRDHQGPRWAASIAASVVGVVLVVYFVAEFNTRKFLVWEYDADTRSMGDSLASHRPQNQEVVRVGGSWQLAQSLWFYAVLRNWTWIELTKESAAGMDFYALVPWERVQVEQKLRLNEIYRGPVSGSVLAKPQ